MAYAGTLTVTVTNMEDEPIEDIHVALIPHYYYFDYSYEQMQEEAWFQGTTGSSGAVTFEKVPENIEYYNEYSVFIYYDEENYEYQNKGIYIRKDEHEKMTFKVDL